MKKSGFTLIELLVVIAIIALLAAIALPVFGAAQERARATQDASQLRQIGIATLAYLSDNNDAMFASAPTVAPTSWPDILVSGKYLPNYKTFHSPFDRRSDPSGAAATSYPISYGFNKQCFDTNMGKFVSASQTIIIAPDLKGAPDQTASWPDTNSDQPTLGVPSASPYLGTHNKQNSINALFGDAHVQTMKWTDFSSQPITSPYAKSLQWYPLGS